jgi:hypothetical protein
MDIADALSQLADIHLPQQPGYWPLAPGWWVLAMLLLALAGYAVWRGVQRWRLQRRYKSAFNELEKCKAQLHSAASGAEPDMAQRLSYVNDVNSVLRRVALLHFSQETVAGLSGKNWVDFMQQHDRSGRLAGDLAQVLAEGRFAPTSDVDTHELHAMAHHWIKNLYMARIKPNTSNIDSTSSTTSPAVDHHA